MKAKKVLFITQEITPYVPESNVSLVGRKLPQAIQENGCEIRTFMPRWGIINERRNQLHEVIRLSGMNIIVDDTDHPLIIKVASIQAARMQVYFIDNDDYFHKRKMRTDENGEEYADNVERAIFYARGVLETVKKLRWNPDIVHCHGWMSSIVPLYLKTAYREEPPFLDSKVVFSAYDDKLQGAMPENFLNSVKFKDANEELIRQSGVELGSADAIQQLAVKFSDGFVCGGESGGGALADFAAASGIPVLNAPGEEINAEAFCDFYDRVLGE